MVTIPERLEGALAGSDFCQTLPDALNAKREQMMLDELLSGNVPSYLRYFSPIEILEGTNSLVIWVSSDYLSVGIDDDTVRLPLNPLSAQKLANAWDCLLPTKKIVDLIWKMAIWKIPPTPLPPTSAMTSVSWFVKSNNLIDEYLKTLPNYSPGQLLAGHKKDVVITKNTFSKSDKVAIYGWHQINGKPIQGPQPNGTSHNSLYSDYSHGIRLVARACTLNGVPGIIDDILRDPQLCKLISEDGPIIEPRYKV